MLCRAADVNPPFRFLDVVSGRRRGVAAGLARAGLAVVSGPYRLAVGLRNWLFDRGWKRSRRAAVPVVSVGNLTLGGTGKTPAVEYLAKWFREQDRRVTILSRGYGAGRGRNDEALVLEENLPDVPHLQGKDRVALARIAVEELESEVLLLDDGFQHRRLARDLDIVLIDVTEPWGYGRVFPRGLLREPAKGLRRADFVILTRCDQAPPEMVAATRAETARWVPGSRIAESIHAPVDLVNADAATEALELVRHRPVAALCGIGNPEAFRRTLANLGPDLTAFEVFPDHHDFTRTDVERLREWARQLPPEVLVLTTQKDLVKLRVSQLGGRPLWAVRVALSITAGLEELHRRLTSVLLHPN